MTVPFEEIVVMCLSLAAVGVSGVTILNITEEVLTITTPNYPNNYPRQTDEYWLLTAEHQNDTYGPWVVNLRLDDFLLEHHSSCVYDYLHVYDGSSESSAQISKLCGAKSRTTISASGPHLYLHFHSDHSYTEKGFTASVWASYREFAAVTPPPMEDGTLSFKIIGGLSGAVAALTIIGIIIYCKCKHSCVKENADRSWTKTKNALQFTRKLNYYRVEPNVDATYPEGFVI